MRKRVGKTIVHREAKTFTHRSAALSWAKYREVELEGQALPGGGRRDPVTLGELIRSYSDTFESISRWQRSKQTHLEFLERHRIGKSNIFALTTAILIDHVRSRRSEGAGPAAVVGHAWTLTDGLLVVSQLCGILRPLSRALTLVSEVDAGLELRRTAVTRF